MLSAEAPLNKIDGREPGLSRIGPRCPLRERYACLRYYADVGREKPVRTS